MIFKFSRSFFVNNLFPFFFFLGLRISNSFSQNRIKLTFTLNSLAISPILQNSFLGLDSKFI